MTQRALSFHYILTGSTGKNLDSSRDGEPLTVLENSGQIIPGLEKELFKMKTGEKKTVHVTAANAYGPVNEELKIKISRDKLPPGELKIGMHLRGGKDHHAPVFTIIKIDGQEVSLDGNHPLAGQDLTFEVEIMEIREATEQERQHGHAHGAHGHDH